MAGPAKKPINSAVGLGDHLMLTAVALGAFALVIQLVYDLVHGLGNGETL